VSAVPRFTPLPASLKLPLRAPVTNEIFILYVFGLRKIVGLNEAVFNLEPQASRRFKPL